MIAMRLPVIHRAQFQTVMRAIWTLYAATIDQLARMTPELSLGTEQAGATFP